MKKRIYIISPFHLLQYPWNSKVYYCVELFSALSRKGYIINWIQPGRGVLGLKLFPSLTHWRNFFVINIGNFITYRWLMPFFLSRLKQASKDIKPFMVIEIVDGDPFELDLDETFLNIPLVFSMKKQWLASDDFPGPVIIPDKEIFNDLIFRGVPEQYLNYIPSGVYPKMEFPAYNKDYRKKKIFIIDKKRELKPLVEWLRKKRSDFEVIYLNSKIFPDVSSGDFYSWVRKTFEEGQNIFILSKGLYHLGMEFLSQGGTVFLPGAEIPFVGKWERMSFYNEPMDIIDSIDSLMLEQNMINFSNNNNTLPTWDHCGIQLEKLLTGLTNK